MSWFVIFIICAGISYAIMSYRQDKQEEKLNKLLELENRRKEFEYRKRFMHELELVTEKEIQEEADRQGLPILDEKDEKAMREYIVSGRLREQGIGDWEGVKGLGA